jgi:hypothetical protein
VQPCLPQGKKPPIQGYALIRPPTIRRDFYAPARNPDHQYIDQASQILRSRGFITIGIGNIDTNEQFDGVRPLVDVELYGGTTVRELMGLLQHAAIIVAGPGYTVPASIAYSTPHVIIYGGAARWNKPSKLIDPSMTHKITWIEPDNFCHSCKNVRHVCDKGISSFKEKFNHAVDRALYMQPSRLHS